MRRDKLDNLVMLLSTDWFLPYWKTIGIHLSPSQEVCVQQGCRGIVHQVVSGRADYYHSDFSLKRIEATKDALLTLLKNCGAEKGVPVELLLFDETTDAAFSDGARWLITILTGRLLQDRIRDGLDSETLEHLDRLGGIIEARQHTNFSEKCLGSESPWDKYTRSLTPEIPRMLGHHVAELISQGEFSTIWTFVNTQLTSGQKQELLEWYQREAKSLTGQDLKL